MNIFTIVTTVANFLLNTSRVVKAIELCKECFIFLSNIGLGKETKFFKFFSMRINQQLLKGYCLIYDYTSAIEYGEKLFDAVHGFGDLFREGEGSLAMKLATLYKQQLKYKKARELFEKGLCIMKETGNRDGEATCYGFLGVFFHHLGQYNKFKEHVEKALKIRKEIGDKQGIAACYGNLGVVFECLGEYEKAREYIRKALSIRKEIGDRQGEATDYVNLGKIFGSIGDHTSNRDYLQKALTIQKEIGNRNGEAACYSNLGSVFYSLGEHAKSLEYLNKALFISKEINYRENEASCYQNLGITLLNLGEYVKGKEYINKSLTISKEIGDVEAEFSCYLNLAWTMVHEGNIQEAILNLFSSIQKCENMRSFLRDNDQLKVSFLDKHFSPYQLLSELFCNIGAPSKALYVIELGRARALTDLMSTKYFVGEQITMSPQSWTGIERIIEKGSYCTCLYISYYVLDIFLWILKANKPLRFRQIYANENFVTKGSVRNLNEFFGKNPFRKFHFLPHGHCEDRSLSLDARHVTPQSQKDSFATLRLVEQDEDDEDDKDQEPKPTLSLVYKMIIAPVADLLDEPEILIVPDRSLYKVPFAALKDESGKYLSETFRIRIAPSLTTLKLIQERPTDNCCETPALIVGDPDVSSVIELSQLPCARKEAEMIGGMLGVQPLLRHQATNLSVLEMMHSASLIHFAAHGDAERGEIALAPVRPINRILHHDDYVLTMSDIAQVQLQAKLVVLSCCYLAT